MKFLKVLSIVGILLLPSVWGSKNGCEGRVNFKSATKAASTTSYVLLAPRKTNSIVITDTVTITGTSKSVVRDAGDWPLTAKVGMKLSIDADTAASDDLIDWQYIEAISGDTITLDRTHGAVASGACTIVEPASLHCTLKIRNEDTTVANVVRYKVVHRREASPDEVDGEELQAEQIHVIEEGLDDVTGFKIWSDAGAPVVTSSFQGPEYQTP